VGAICRTPQLRKASEADIASRLFRRTWNSIRTMWAAEVHGEK
jgi:hypothetical protein